MAGKKGAKVPSRYLRDLQWAYKHAHDEAKGTPMQEEMRTEAKKDFKAFWKLVSDEQERFRRAKSPEKAEEALKPGADVPLDEGEERCIELAERLIKECAARATGRAG